MKKAELPSVTKFDTAGASSVSPIPKCSDGTDDQAGNWQGGAQSISIFDPIEDAIQSTDTPLNIPAHLIQPPEIVKHEHLI